MHEQIIAKRIIAEANRHGAVVGIEVHCGEVAHIPADELGDALTMLTDWNVQVTEVPAEVKCQCGFTGRPRIVERGHDHAVWECPECETKMPRLLKGDEIVLVSVDVKNE